MLTKTHCDGTGLGSHWLRSKEDFLGGCLRTTVGGLSSSPSVYDLSSVRKAVHLIRNPFDNIVSRFHHERNNHMSDKDKVQYESSPAGFRAYCHDKQDITKWRIQLTSPKAKKLWAHLDGVPCHIDFLRYIIWHNNAFEVLSDSSKPTFILHYESYATDWRATVSALLDFLDQPFVERNRYIPFASDKVYRDYFSTGEMVKIREAFDLLASEQTRSHTKQYFESLPSAAEAAESLPQRDRGKGTLSGPGIVWLMSFPNSGTSYTLRAVRKASSISFATNYGEESRDHQLRSIPGTDFGPYWPCCKNTQPKICPFQCPNKGLVLTKTHCTGYQHASIGPISHGSFLEGCLSTTAGMDRSGLYDVGRVERFVHLIRDPFDNIISRFHHMRNNLMTDEEKLRYDDSPTGFRRYCRAKIDVVRWEKKMNSFPFTDELLGSLQGVPCHVDFLRYILWHNNAFEVTSADKPSLVLHYESYLTDWNTTMSYLLDFLGQTFTSKRDNRLPFESGKSYRGYFTPDEEMKIETIFQKICSETTWANTVPYMLKEEIPLPHKILGSRVPLEGSEIETLPSKHLSGVRNPHWHPRERQDRFPSVDARVRLYMSSWYLPPCGEPELSFTRNDSSAIPKVSILKKTHAQPLTIPRKPLRGEIFSLQNESLVECARNRDDSGLLLASYCDDLRDDFRTFFIDSNAPVLTVVGDIQAEEAMKKAEIHSIPIIAKYRRSASRGDIHDATSPTATKSVDCIEIRKHLHFTHGGKHGYNESTPLPPIVWKLNTRRHFGSNLEIVRSHSKMLWKDKIPRAIWRGALTGHGSSQSNVFDAEESCKMMDRCKFVIQHFESDSIDAGFVSKKVSAMYKWAAKKGLTKDKLSIEEQLHYKILISLEGNDVSSGLKWMLLSNSVVLMPPPTRTSWAMEELLEPFVHYVPMAQDGSNAEEMVRWILDNDESAERIAERATLFMEDMLYHPDAEEDEQQIKREIMKRYQSHWSRRQISHFSEDMTVPPQHVKTSNVLLPRTPPLSEVVQGDEIIGDVDWELDFAIGGFSKCGTSFLMRLFASHDELQVHNHELCLISDNRTAKFATDFYKSGGAELDGRTKKVGYKCPVLIESDYGLQNYARYFPTTDLIISLRCVLAWHHSFCGRSFRM